MLVLALEFGLDLICQSDPQPVGNLLGDDCPLGGPVCFGRWPTAKGMLQTVTSTLMSQRTSK